MDFPFHGPFIALDSVVQNLVDISKFASHERVLDRKWWPKKYSGNIIFNLAHFFRAIPAFAFIVCVLKEWIVLDICVVFKCHEILYM